MTRPLEAWNGIARTRPTSAMAMPEFRTKSVCFVGSTPTVRMRTVGVDPTKHTDFVRNSGIAIALVGLVRAIPFQASSGRVTLPADLCEVAGLDPTQSHQWPRNPNVSEITLPMLVTAKRHLKAARKSSHQLPRVVMPAMLPLSLSALYLKALQRYGGDPKALAERPIGLPRHLTLMWRSILGRP